MDNTKEYITQCQKATEIQDKAEWVGGDYVYGYFWGGYDVVPLSCKEHNMDVFNKKKQITWLPTQDDLQQMYYDCYSMVDMDGNKISNWATTLYMFFNFISFRTGDIKGDCVCGGRIMDTFNLNNKYNSMCQLWLAFVMENKYSKRWSTDKQDWIPIE